MRYEECQSPAFYPSFLRTCGIKLSGWKGVGVKLSLSKGLLAKRNKLKGQKGHNIFQKKVQGFDMEGGVMLQSAEVCLWERQIEDMCVCDLPFELSIYACVLKRIDVKHFTYISPEMIKLFIEQESK